MQTTLRRCLGRRTSASRVNYAPVRYARSRSLRLRLDPAHDGLLELLPGSPMRDIRVHDDRDDIGLGIRRVHVARERRDVVEPPRLHVHERLARVLVETPARRAVETAERK